MRSFFDGIIKSMQESTWLRTDAQSDDERRHALAHELGVPFVTFERHDVEPDALFLIPEPLARAHNLVAYRSGDGTVEVALLDLGSLEALEPLRPRLPKLLPRLTTEESIKHGLLRYQQLLKEKFGQGLAEVRDPAKLLRGLMSHALAAGASAIHLDPTQTEVRVRYRIGGHLYDGLVLPKDAHTRLCAALPASGSGTVELGYADQAHVRVHMAQGALGTKIVLHPERAHGATLESLGMHGAALERVHRHLSRRRGFVLVGGTAGKSTLLGSLRNMVDTMHVSVAAPADAASLRAALRADADIVVMDDIPDRECAKLLSSAASRGVLVVASLPAGRQAQADLMDEMEPDLFIEVGVLRRLCQKQFHDLRRLSRSEGEALEAYTTFAPVFNALRDEDKIKQGTAWKDVLFAHPVPCGACEQGYKGLVGIYAVQDRAGVVGLTLVEDALFKAAEGLTSVEEVVTLL